MTSRQFGRIVGTTAVIAAFAIAGVVTHVRADGDDNDNEAKVKRGFQIAPVPLKLAGKNRALVGLGSYLVNAAGDCNGCHSAGPATEFTPSGNPYLLKPVFDGTKKFNPDTYLGGGRDFGPFPSPASPTHIVSRNLTPDKTGLPLGGDSFAEFRNIIRTGVDPDHVHPSLPFPFNGAELQIMPWVVYQSMTDRDLRAIYEYLSAIPCIAGPPAPSLLHHDCF